MQKLQAEFEKHSLEFIMQFLADSAIPMVECSDPTDSNMMIVQFTDGQVAGFKFGITFVEVLYLFNRYKKLMEL